jgi:hypothetical protein
MTETIDIQIDGRDYYGIEVEFEYTDWGDDGIDVDYKNIWYQDKLGEWWDVVDSVEVSDIVHEIIYERIDTGRCDYPGYYD